ncbi:MAG: diacylglycerol kinase family protein [Chloroflexota bacterium]|nr:diacylglycerol kinase family protein [Chloroflexota bacterium]
MDVRLVYNPVAGRYDAGKALQRVIDFLQAQGWEVSVSRTQGPGDATVYAREAVKEGADIVVAVGGDGTLGEVASGLAHSDCALGVLPVGTGNVWAHMLGLPVWTPNRPSALLEAARTLVEGKRFPIDLGQMGNRYFVLWTGVGFDAQVVHDVEPHRELRRQFGNLAYFVTAITLSLQLRGTPVTVSVDGKMTQQRAVLILVTNVQFYGRPWRVAPEARMDDGLLEVYIFKGGGTLNVVGHVVSVLRGRQLHNPNIEVHHGREVVIRSEKPLPVHVDGDPAGYTPITISVMPKTLQVIVPPSSSDFLFGDAKASDARRVALGQRILDNLRERRQHLLGEKSAKGKAIV